jgi:hypothetical protein
MPHELRAKKDLGLSNSVKLPVCKDIHNDMRRRLVREGDWSDDAMRSRGTYVANMYGYEAAGRIGEYTHSERNQVDHCARVDDFIFAVDVKDAISN